MPIVTCRNVSAVYERQPAVKDVSFELEAGDYLCVIGENGSGKSTLMKGLLRLIKVSGEVEFSGVKQTEIGYLPQQTIVQKDFPASVSEVVLSGCLNKRGALPFYTRADRESAIRNMERLGIGGFGKKLYRGLSCGQQQRALLARALCATEKLLMLDEPVSGLDPAGANELYALLSELNRKDGITIVMITHDIQSAIEYGSKILHMRTSPVYFGDKEEYMKTREAAGMLGGGHNT